MIPFVKGAGDKPVSINETLRVDDEDRPLRADARRNRERILESARAAFAETGVETQMDDVARRAGVGVGTVYRHFPTKDALLTELVRQKFEQMADDARASIANDVEQFEVLEAFLRRSAAATAQDVGMQFAIANVGEEVWTQAPVELAELIAALGAMVEGARRAGTIRPDIEAIDIGMLMCAVCSTMGPASEFDWRRHLDLVIDILRPRL